MRTAIFLLLVTLALAQKRLNYMENPENTENIEQLIKKFASLQEEVFSKVFMHYIVEKVAVWRSQGSNDNTIKNKIVALIMDANNSLLSEMTRYMKEKLFHRLDMGTLTQSLQDQIKARPEDFYLTFDIYDLLFD